jgi:hypothetical protein
MSAQVSGILLVAAFGLIAAACAFLAVRLVGLGSPDGRPDRHQGPRP